MALVPERLDLLQALARADVDSGRLPACQLAVGLDGRVVFFAAYGAAGTNTRFGIRSATKAIVASAVWLLLGEGELDPAAPVHHYVPEFAADGRERVRVDHLLLHTAGLDRAMMDPLDGTDPDRRRHQFTRWRPDPAPGTRYAYHAVSAHWVLVDILERVSGVDYRDLVEQRICRPLGLPRVLGIPVEEQHDIAPTIYTGTGPWAGSTPELDQAMNDPAVRAVGVPSGGAILTAADLARFYQALLHNPGRRWDPDVLADVTGTIRCRLIDPVFKVPCNRSRGLVLAGDDGQQTRRYGAFGRTNSPRSFGHAGAHMQIGWADPATGLSFAYLTNGADPDSAWEIRRAVRLSTAAASLLDEWDGPDTHPAA